MNRSGPDIAQRPSGRGLPVRRGASWVALTLLITGGGLLAVSALSGARFELVVAGLGLAAGGALIGLLAAVPKVSVVRERRPGA
jgi:hypothetical protein